MRAWGVLRQLLAATLGAVLVAPAYPSESTLPRSRSTPSHIYEAERLSKTRVWGSNEKILLHFRAVRQLSGEQRWGCAKRSRKIAVESGVIYDYDAFGNLIHSTGSTPNNYLFAGEQFDPDLNLYYNRARYLNTSTCRFWNADSNEGDAASPISLHKYAYTGNDPVDRLDPSGHDFDLGSLSAANAIATTLNNIEANVGQAVIQQIQNGGSGGLRDLLFNVGVTVLFLAAPAILGAVGRSTNQFRLRFSQTTANSIFSTDPEALFRGETIGSLARKILNEPDLVPKIPVRYVVVDGNALIFDTRSSLALLRANVPQEQWNLINVTGDSFFEGQIKQRLENNSLTSEGTDFIQITSKTLVSDYPASSLD
jgi:RHS repeat-associated protein